MHFLIYPKQLQGHGQGTALYYLFQSRTSFPIHANGHCNSPVFLMIQDILKYPGFKKI